MHTIFVYCKKKSLNRIDNFHQKNAVATSKTTKLTTKCVVCFDHPSTILIEVPIFYGFLINIAPKKNRLCILT
jgi:hypothetical protein